MPFEKWMWNPLEWIRLRRWLKKARHMTFNQAWYETWKGRARGKINDSLLMSDIMQKVLKGYPLSLEQEMRLRNWCNMKPENAALYKLMKNPEAYFKQMKAEHQALVADLQASGFKDEAEYDRAMLILNGRMMSKKEMRRLQARLQQGATVPEKTPEEMAKLWNDLRSRTSLNKPNDNATK